jgi:hypothetical protein
MLQYAQVSLAVLEYAVVSYCCHLIKGSHQMPQETQIEDKPSDYVRLKPGDPERVARLAERMQQNSVGPVYKNIVVSKALDALERELALAKPEAA